MFFYKAVLPLKDLADVAISAISGQEKYGAITGLAQEYGISRQNGYDLEFQQGQSRNRKKSHNIGQKILRTKEKMDNSVFIVIYSLYKRL
jgi:hypothetical protein